MTRISGGRRSKYLLIVAGALRTPVFQSTGTLRSFEMRLHRLVRLAGMICIFMFPFPSLQDPIFSGASVATPNNIADEITT